MPTPPVVVVVREGNVAKSNRSQIYGDMPAPVKVCCQHCNWWRPHPDGATGNCIAEPPRIVVQVPSQVPIYYAAEIPLALRGSQFCVHPTTAAAEVCRLFQLKEIMS